MLCGGVVAGEAAFAARGTVAPVARRSVKAPTVTAGDFRTGGNRVETPVIGILPGKIITEHLTFDIAPVDGDKRPDVARDLVKIAVIERHGENGNRATGFVKGFGLRRGAIASTVCHDHHNIAVVGADYGDMALAANRLGQIEGGFVVVEGGRVLAELALPVAGLMSLRAVREGARRAGGAARRRAVAGGDAGGAVPAAGLPVPAGDPASEDHRSRDGRCGPVRGDRLTRPLWPLTSGGPFRAIPFLSRIAAAMRSDAAPPGVFGREEAGVGQPVRRACPAGPARPRVALPDEGRSGMRQACTAW